MQHIYNSWNPWTEKSMHILYQSQTKGIGNGEHKILGEVEGTGPYGQNSPYDLDIPSLRESRVDVKELDKGTFNTGVNGRNALRPIKAELANLLTIINLIGQSSNTPSEIAHTIKNLNKKGDKSPDEICESAVRELTKICQQLCDYRISVISKLKLSTTYDSFTGHQSQIRSDAVYRIAIAEGKTPVEIKTKLGEDYDLSKTVVEHLSHPYILEPQLLVSNLKKLKLVFEGYTLIFVDETKGYYIMNDPCEKVEFIRITKGSPRFKVHLETY